VTLCASCRFLPFVLLRDLSGQESPLIILPRSPEKRLPPQLRLCLLQLRLYLQRFAHARRSDTWPPNKVRGFRLWWDDAQPVLFLDILCGAQPQQDDELRIWYAKRQTIQDLDSAAVTTIMPDHESSLVKGAAAHCALSRTVDLIEVAGADLYAIGLLGTWGRAKEREWYTFLESLRKKSARSGVPWGEGWRLDKWD